MSSPTADSATGELGHPRYLALLDELRDLHAEKSGSYGTESDPLANFRAVSQLTGQPPWYYALERIVEKAQRVASLAAQGRFSEIEEFKDIAGLALCAEVLRREEHARTTTNPPGA